MRTNYYQVPDNASGIGGREQQHSILDTLPLTLVTWHLVMIVRGGRLTLEDKETGSLVQS